MTEQKVALITGVTGQDGAYLAEFLLGKNYVVHGIKRRTSLFNTDRIDHLYQDRHEKDVQFFLHHGDLTDSSSLTRIIKDIQPDEIYNLAAQSHVAVSFEEPEYTANSDAIGTLRLLEAVRLLGLGNKTRFYQASTSELYGLVQETPQKRLLLFIPAVLMLWPSFTLTGSRLITARPTGCLHVTEFYSTMSHRSVAKPLSLARSRVQWLA